MHTSYRKFNREIQQKRTAVAKSKSKHPIYEKWRQTLVRTSSKAVARPYTKVQVDIISSTQMARPISRPQIVKSFLLYAQ